MDGSCPACGARAGEVFFEREGVLATTNVLYARREDALAAPRGTLRMVQCARCSHVFNSAFAAERASYDAGYENALHFSPTFDRHQRRLAEALIQRHELRGKRLIEIGCGDGSFLRALCEAGDNVGVGVDRLAPDATADARVRFVRANDLDAVGDVDFDFVCSRHTLEHVVSPRSFLRAWRRWAARHAAGVYVEVPNGAVPFCDDSVWDLIHEHVSYFTPQSLAHACASGGIAVDAIEETFGGQHLSVHGRLASGEVTAIECANPPDLERRLSEFAERFSARLAAARDLLESGSPRTVLWGAGSKGITLLDATAGAGVVAAVDVNPRKHGRWIGGVGVPVVAPGALRAMRPDRVVVVNELYVAEIRAALRELSVEADVVVA